MANVDIEKCKLSIQVLDLLPTPVVCIDKEFTVTFMNPAGAGVMGKKPEDVIGLKCYDLFKTHHCRTPECRCAQAMEKDGVFTGETVADPSGLNLPIQYTACPMKDADGNIVGALEYVVDFTETRKAMDAAQQKVDNLDSIPTPIVTIDRDFSVTYMNPAGAGVMGKRPEDVIGLKCYDLFKTPHCGTPECRCAQAMQKDGVFTGETVADPSGLNLPIMYTGAPIKDAKGDIIGAIEYVIDITETKKAMDAAQQKVDNLDSIPTPIVTIDRDFSVTYMNPAGAGVMGKRPEDVIGLKCYDLFKTPHCGTPECRCAQAMQKDGVFTGETVADPSGLNLPIMYTGAPIKDAKGDIVGAIEYVIDITETKKAMDDAIEKVGYLNDIPTPILTIDKNFTITYMNPAGAGVAGKTPEQVIGMKCYDLFKTPHCGTPECRCGQAMTQKQIATGETIVDPGGLNIPIMYTGAPIKDADGNVIGALEYVVNITETRKAMDDANAKVDFLNNIPTPVMVVDKDMTIQFMNPAGAKAVGRTPEQCQGQKCFSLFNTDHCNTSNCQVAKAIQQNGVFTGDTVAKLPSGALPIRYTGAPLKDEAGNIVGGLEYVVDISEENQAVAEVEHLVEAATAGKLDVRGNPENYHIIGFKNVVKGINDTLEAIVVPLNEAMSVLEAVANSDLTKKVVGDYKGQLGEFKDNINTAVKNLHDALTQAASAADQVGSGSAQVAASSQQLSEGAAEQAASLEETSSSLEEMSSMVKQNADNANQANNLMEEANRVVGRAKDSMGDVTNSMDDISQASEETQKIIKTIDEIAFQTNLLALNAAVEAARAGEAGAGFAVVADEVRNLAMRAADAAKNTADLIEGTVKRVKAGSELVTKTNEAFDEVAKSAAKVGELVGEIAAASQEQASGIDQVNKTMAEMDKVTQQNAAGAEESASASEEMSSQAQELQSMLGTFKLNGQGAERRQVITAAPKRHWAPDLAKVAHVQKKADDATDTKAKAKAATPEAVIPMEDDKKTEDAEFRDF